MKITVLGAGTWGTALALILHRSNHDVNLWEYNKDRAVEFAESRVNEYLPDTVIPQEIVITSDLSCASSCELIISAVPSFAVRQTMRNLAEIINDKPIIVSTSKGFEVGSLKVLSEVIVEELPRNKVAVLMGPSHAEEVCKNMPTAVIAGSVDRQAAELVQDAFMMSTFRVYTNSDMVGAEIGGALKNVIAICSGIVDGLGLGENSRAALITRAIAEIARTGLKLGADLRTFYGLAGIGDLIATCTSPHSRNYKAGLLIGQGKSMEEAQEAVGMVVEGVRTAKAAHELSVRHGISMPIMSATYEVLYNNRDPQEALNALMTREKKGETEEEVVI